MITLKTEILEEANERIVKGFLDLIIMIKLRDAPMSGYDAINFINKKFNLLMSPGTVYTQLYSLERGGLIESTETPRKSIYELTDEGKEKVKAFLNSREKVLGLVLNLFVGE